MEVDGLSSDVAALGRMMVYSVVEAVVVGTLSAARRSLADFLMMFQTGSLLKDMDALPKLPGIDKRFPIDGLHRRKHPGPENKDASDTEDDDEDDDDAQEEEDDEGDEDFSGEEGGDDDDDEAGDPEVNPEANGNGGSDDEDDDDEDGDEDDEGDEDEDEDEEEEDEDEDEQPPAKKRK